MRRSLGLLAAVAVCAVVGWLAVAGGWGPLPAPAKRDEVRISPASGGTLATAGLRVRVPRGAVTAPSDLRLEAVEASDVGSTLARARGRRHELRLDGRLRRPARLDFAIPRTDGDERFFVVRRARAGATWRVVPGRGQDGTHTVRSSRFSDWQLRSWSPGRLRDQARSFYRGLADTRIDVPKCPDEPPDASATVVPASDPALYACLEARGPRYRLTLHSNRAVGMSVAVPDGWEVRDTFGKSLGEGVADALTQAARSAPGSAGRGGRIALLPSTGRLVLETSKRTTTELGVSPDNFGATVDAVVLLLGKTRMGKETESARERREQVADIVTCLYDAREAGRSFEVTEAVRTAVRCVAGVRDVPKLALTVLFAEVFKGVAAQVDAVRDTFREPPRVIVRFAGSEEEASSPEPSAPVRRPAPPRPDARRSGFPTCAEYEQLPRAEADALLRRLVATYEDRGASSVSLARLSLAAFCRLNPGRSIAGIYGGGSQGTTPATRVPTCSEFLRMNDAEADAVLDLIATRHNDDSSISTRRLSAAAFCRLHPDRRVDGIYGGGG